MNAPMRDRDPGNTHNPLHCTDHLESPWQTSARISWQPSDFNLWTSTEPAVWTSLPVRRIDLNSQEVIYIPSSGVTCNVNGIAYRWCPLSHACGNEGIRQTVQTRNDYPNECFTRCESDIPYDSVFHESGYYDTESPHSESVDSFNSNCDVYSNESEDDDVSDYYDNTECEFYSNVNEESDVMCDHDNLPIALGDLDYILRMLPSNVIERDIFLKHMTDEEVALIMYNHVDDDEDEEIVSLTIMHEDVFNARLPNPVACLLERSANEVIYAIIMSGKNENPDTFPTSFLSEFGMKEENYFLPIACDALKDKR